MPRLSADQWERARADYEVRGLGMGEIGRRYGVTKQAVAKKIKTEGWVQGKSSHIVDRKVSAIKDFRAAELESSRLSSTLQMTVAECVQEQLQQEGILASLANAVAAKARSMVDAAASPEDLEVLSRIKKNLTPPPAPAQTSVTVQQAQVRSREMEMSPEEVCAALIAEQQREIEEQERREREKRAKTVENSQ